MGIDEAFCLWLTDWCFVSAIQQTKARNLKSVVCFLFGFFVVVVFFVCLFVCVCILLVCFFFFCCVFLFVVVFFCFFFYFVCVFGVVFLGWFFFLVHVCMCFEIFCWIGFGLHCFALLFCGGGFFSLFSPVRRISKILSIKMIISECF